LLGCSESFLELRGTVGSSIAAAIESMSST